MSNLRGLRIALLTIVGACAAFAQRDLSTLAGTITDSSGAVIANAKVTITEAATGQSYTITTNSLGEFVRPALKAIHIYGERQRCGVQEGRTEERTADRR